MDRAYEDQRLEATRSFGLLYTARERLYDEIVRSAAAPFRAEMAALCLMDADKLWMKASIGLKMTEVPREFAFCDHTIRQRELTLVEDTHEDQMFRTNPYVVGEPRIRFYVGVPLMIRENLAIGTLCVMKDKPSTATSEQCRTLDSLAQTALQVMNLNRLSSCLRSGK